MKRLMYRLALAVGLTAVVSLSAAATVQPTPLLPAFDSTDEVLLANRLRRRGIRFNVRSSRFRRGAFSRGTCLEGAVPIVPIPEDESETSRKDPFYTTTAARPTFFIYVPEMAGASGFIYVDRSNTTEINPQIYKVAFDLGRGGGIWGIEMPDDVPPLEEGAQYRWRAVLRCDAAVGSEVFTGAEIERVAGIDGTTEERLDYYLDAGIWQDTVELIAADRSTNDPSTGADEDWAILMEASGIPEFADTPIVAITEGRLSE